MKKKKVFFVTGSMLRGGAERVISIVSNYFSENNWEVTILQLLYGGCEYPLNPRIKIIDISQSARNQIIDTPRLIFTIQKLIKQFEPNVVISFMMTINVVCAAALCGSHIPFITCERNDPSVNRSFFWKKLVQWSYKQSTLTIFQTIKARNYFEKYIQNKSVVIENPVNVSIYAERKNTKRIVNVGRLERQKNQKLLISAFFEVIKHHPEYTLELYGRGSLFDELKIFISTLGLSEQVFLKGNVNDVHNQIADAELFVLSSNYEGLSNALIEAMMMGLPCITTDCAGSNEIIISGFNGIVIPKNDVKAMSDAMLYMLENKSVSYEMAENAKRSTRVKFGAENVCAKWLKVVEGVL